MEGIERRRDINFLNENIKVSFEIAQEALSNLPVVSEEDTQTGRERYRALLGSVERRGRTNPYIFGIAARREDGEMEYNFYRMVRTRSTPGYGFKLLDTP